MNEEIFSFSFSSSSFDGVLQMDRELIDMFIEQGRTNTAFNEAARWGLIDVVREMLETGIPIDGRGESGGTALMQAASSGENEIVKLLLASGADVNAKHSQCQKTPLNWCLAALHSEKQYIATASILLKAGASVNLKDTNGLTPIDRAVERKLPDLVKLLQQSG